MYTSTTLAALIAVASVAPTFGYPIKHLGHKLHTGVEVGHGLANAAQGFNDHQTRDYEDILARMYELEARDNDYELFERGVEAAHPQSESGALNFKKIIGGAAKLFFRDEDELMARDDVEDLTAREDDLMSRKIHLGKIFKGVAKGAAKLLFRDDNELVARSPEPVIRRPINKIPVNKLPVSMNRPQHLIGREHHLIPHFTGRPGRIVGPRLDELD